MISLKRLMSAKEDQAAETYARVCSLLLQAMALHAVEGDKQELDLFRSAMASAETAMSACTEPSELLVATGSAVKSLQDYNRRTTHFVRAQGKELQSMIGMLTGAVSEIGKCSERSTATLQEIEKQIAAAAMVDDIRVLRGKLSECLIGLKEESSKHKVHSAAAMSTLETGMQQVRKEADAWREIPHQSDPVTGLPSRPSAEAAIQEHQEKGAHTYAGMIVVGRLRSIRARYEGAVSEQFVNFIRKHLSDSLGPEDSLFRWAEESFLVLLTRSGNTDNVRKEMERVFFRRLEFNCQVSARSVALPVVTTWTVLPTYELAYPALLQKLEAFRASALRVS